MNEVGTPMDAGSDVSAIAVSRDGKWIVSGTTGGHVIVWDAESHRKVTEFEVNGKKAKVLAVDISQDSTKIASGSSDWPGTVSVWSLTGQRLLGPFEHSNWIAAVKFSPDGGLLATGTGCFKSTRIYSCQDGCLVTEFPVCVVSSHRGSQFFAWANDGKRLFAFSNDGRIHCLDASTEQMLSEWATHVMHSPGGISLAGNDAFIAAFDDSSVSFWDTTPHNQIGSIIRHPACIASTDISANYDLVICGGTKITLQNLLDTIPSSYIDDHVRISALNLDMRLRTHKPHY